MVDFNVTNAKAAGLHNPTSFSATDGEGESRDFILSKYPSMQGLEIMAELPLSSIAKFGAAAITKEIATKTMAFVAIELPGGIIQRLDSEILINNHTGDWEAVCKIVIAMAKKNCSFFRNGRILDFLNDFALNSIPKVIKMWTALSAQSSRTDTQP